MINEMRLKGYEVTFYPVELRKTQDKILRILSASAYQKKLNRFHQHIIKQERNNKYDYIIFLQVHTFSIANFIRLRQNHMESKFVFYSWDALSPVINYKPYLPYFDNAYTFDPHDAKMCNINYLPLFCIRDFQNQPAIKTKYDVYMVGNLVKTERYQAVLTFEKYCKKNKISFKKHLKCTPVVMFKLLLKGFIPHGLKLHSIPREKFILLLRQSKATFDFANHKQSGYTMRFIENMCSGKKIITNNKHAVQETFYSPDRFFIFDELKFDGITNFLKEPIKNNDKQYEQFYIQSFIKTLLT